MFGHSVPLRLVPAVSASALARVRSATRAVAFWLAVVLPLVYLPAVVAGGLLPADPTLLGWFVTGNLVAILLGHGHEPTLGRRAG